MNKPMLTIELVPETCWYSNLRKLLSKEDWDRLRKAIYRHANFVCEVCGGKGPQWPVECHERWDYDDKNHVQKLIGLTALCPECHLVKHIGFSGIQGHGEASRRHLAKVNGWSKDFADAYVEEALVVWEKRSLYDWSLDLGWLAKYGVEIPDLSKERESQQTFMSDEVREEVMDEEERIRDLYVEKPRKKGGKRGLVDEVITES